jgi:hypothetical protein
MAQKLIFSKIYNWDVMRDCNEGTGVWDVERL